MKVMDKVCCPLTFKISASFFNYKLTNKQYCKYYFVKLLLLILNQIK